MQFSSLILHGVFLCAGEAAGLPGKMWGNGDGGKIDADGGNGGGVREGSGGIFGSGGMLGSGGTLINGGGDG